MGVAVLAGGVGAARFLDGLVRVLDPADVIVICNVGDDFAWQGLYVSPDIDTVVYTLAGIEGSEGWGIAGDSFFALDTLEELGEERWFAIGDRDLATHVWRSARLDEGRPLHEVTGELARARGLRCTVLPVTDDPHPTVVVTGEGELAFQDYFVRRRQQDEVVALRWPRAENARPAPGVIEALREADVVVIAPSNPFVSIEPLLVVPGVREALVSTSASRIAVSPIIGGEAVKGPAAAMLRSLGHEVSALGVARLYAELVDCFVLDETDRALVPDVEALGMRAAVTETLMSDDERRARLAADVLAFAHPDDR